VEYGHQILDEKAKQLGFSKLDEAALQRIQVAYGESDREELFYRIGIGAVKVDNLGDVLKSKQRVSLLRKFFMQKEKPPKKQEKTYITGGKDDDGHLFVIASCCNPIPGDPVVGFKSPDGRITVHKKSCPVAEEIAATHGDWVVVPKWLEVAKPQAFLVRISLKGLDRVGLLNEISRFLSLVMGANMRRLNLSADEGIFSGYIDLYVNSKDVLEQILRKLSHIDGIESVSRSEL
jgi:GTP pyrophosphokinase